MDVKDMFVKKDYHNPIIIKFFGMIICILGLTFLSGCLHCSYKLEIPQEAQLGDEIEYSLWVQNPYPLHPQFDLEWDENCEDSDVKKWHSERKEAEFTVTVLDSKGSAKSSDSDQCVDLVDTDLGFGKNTFKFCLKGAPHRLELLKSGKVNIYFYLYRISDYKLAPAFSHEIYRGVLNPKITDKK